MMDKRTSPSSEIREEDSLLESTNRLNISEQ